MKSADCASCGCMPTKALLYAAEVSISRTCETWGRARRKGGFDFTKVMARKNAQIKEFAVPRRNSLPAVI